MFTSGKWHNRACLTAAEAKLVEGQLLLVKSGDKPQALALFNEAKTTFEELGLKRMEKEANQFIQIAIETVGAQ